MKTRPYLLHALSPLHAGTGQAADIVDLPIMRYKATGIPFVPGSSVKGVLRDARQDKLDQDEWFAVFGPDKDKAAEHAGALMVGDARLLALPVRSFQGTFAWVTSPLLLTLARRDLGAEKVPLPRLGGREAVVWRSSVNCVGDVSLRLYLEDLDLPARRDATLLDGWKPWLKPVFGQDWDELFARRFAVVDDETMTFLWETATQIDARVSLDPTLRTVAPGALWLEESLPPETLLIGLLAGDRSRRGGAKLEPEEVLDRAMGTEEVLQFGGKASVGRGRCRIVQLTEVGA